MRTLLQLALTLFLVAASGTPIAVNAADPTVIRLGTSQAVDVSFLPIDVGQAAGIWQRLGLQLEVAAFRGDAQLQQAITSNTVDIGLGSGPALGFLAKGVPALAIAVLEAGPGDVCLFVPENSPIKNVKDLKGKRIGVSTAGSLTEWLIKRLAVKQGWAPDAVTTVPLGGAKEMIAGLETHQVDATIAATETAYDMQQAHSGRVLLTFANMVDNFYDHIIYARTDYIDAHPDLVQKFLKGWFQSVAYMRAHRSETIALGAKKEGVSEAAMASAYDSVINTMSKDGAFDKASLTFLSHSFVELNILDHVPDPYTLITTKFVPVRL